MAVITSSEKGSGSNAAGWSKKSGAGVETPAEVDWGNVSRGGAIDGVVGDAAPRNVEDGSRAAESMDAAKACAGETSCSGLGIGWTGEFL